MAWYFGDTRITVVDGSSVEKQIIARLQPLDGGTVHQIFGYESRVSNLTCYVVTYDDLAALIAMSRTGLSYTLTAHGDTVGNFYIASLKHQLLNTIAQTFRPDKECDDQVYSVEMELYLDE